MKHPFENIFQRLFTKEFWDKVWYWLIVRKKFTELQSKQEDTAPILVGIVIAFIGAFLFAYLFKLFDDIIR